MKQLMLYCRSGFEKECAGEIQDKATQLEVYGFPRVKKTQVMLSSSVTKMETQTN